MIEIADWEWGVEWAGCPTEIEDRLNEYAAGWILHEFKIDKMLDGDDGYLFLARHPREKGPK